MNRSHWCAARAASAVLVLFAALLAGAAAPVRAQDTTAAAPDARAADVESMDAILGALYDVISGPAGAKRDWDRFLSLFAPGARLIPSVRKPDGGVGIRVLTPEEYASNIGPRLEETGFFEREAARTVDAFGHIAQVFSTYESRRAAADAEPFQRGINSIQLLHDGQRWWVVTIYWEGERPDNPIPAKYLKR